MYPSPGLSHTWGFLLPTTEPVRFPETHLCNFLRHTWAPRLGPATCPAWLTWSFHPHTCSCPCQPGATGAAWGRGSRTQPQLVSHPHACPSEGPQGPWFPAKGAPSGACVYLCRKDRTQSGQTDLLWSCHLLVSSGRSWTFSEFQGLHLPKECDDNTSLPVSL